MPTTAGSSSRRGLVARTLDEEARYEPGEKVSVFEIDGATAVVG